MKKHIFYYVISIRLGIIFDVILTQLSLRNNLYFIQDILTTILGPSRFGGVSGSLVFPQ